MDLCVAANIGCDEQRLWGFVLIGWLFVGLVGIALIQTIWNRAHRRRRGATPIAARHLPIRRHPSPTYPVKIVGRHRIPRLGLGKLVRLILSIPGGLDGF